MISKKILTLAGALVSFGALSSAYADSPLISLGEDASIYALATAAVTYNDNIYLYHTNKESDVILRLSPGLEFIKGEEAESTLRIRFVEDLIYYMDKTDNNTQLENLSMSYSYNGSRLTGSITAGLNRLQQNTNREANNSVHGGTVVRQYNYYANALGDYQIGEKTYASSGFKWNGVTYDNYRDQYNDRQTYGVPVTLSYAVTEKMRVGVNYEYRYTDLASNSKNRANYYTPGYSQVHFIGASAVGGLTDKLSLSGRVGYTTSKYNRRTSYGVDVSGNSNSTLGFGLTASYRATEKTTLTLSGTRDFEISSSAAGGSIITTGAQLAVNHVQSEHWMLNGSFAFRQDDYQDYDRKDNVYTLAAGCGYAINEYLSFTATYSFQWNDSDYGNYGYTNNTVTLALVFRY